MPIKLSGYNTEVTLSGKPWQRGVQQFVVNGLEIPFLLPALSAHHFFTGVWPPPPDAIDYEPHESPGVLQRITGTKAVWHQSATAYARVETQIEYHLTGPGSLEIQIETRSHATSYPFGYVGLFWGTIAPPGGQRGFHTIVADAAGKLDWHYFCGHGDNMAPARNTILGSQMSSLLHSSNHPPTYFFAESKRKFALPIQVARWRDLYYCLEVDNLDIAFTDVLMGTAVGGPSWDVYWCLQPGERRQIRCRLTIGPWAGWQAIKERYQHWPGCVEPTFQIKSTGQSTLQPLTLPVQPKLELDSGLALSKRLYEERGKSILEELNLLSICSVGCFGGTSQNTGLDDAVSRDHIWGPYLTFLLPTQHWAEHHERLRAKIQEMPDEVQGHAWVGYNGSDPRKTNVYEFNTFLQLLTGLSHRPQTEQEWLPYLTKSSWLGRRWTERIFDAGQGQVFHDPQKQFTQLHRHWTGFVPPNLHKALLARAIFRVWNAGPEYNLQRLSARDPVMFRLGVAWFVNEVMDLAFYWNEQYVPFQKWRLEHFLRLPICPVPVTSGIEALSNLLDAEQCLAITAAMIDAIKLLMQDLYHLPLSRSLPLSTFAHAIHEQIEDVEIKQATGLEW